MPLIVPHNTVCKCSFGTAPCNLVVLPNKKVNINNLPVATFALCTTTANPAVAAANVGVWKT